MQRYVSGSACKGYINSPNPQAIPMLPLTGTTSNHFWAFTRSSPLAVFSLFELLSILYRILLSPSRFCGLHRLLTTPHARVWPSLHFHRFSQRTAPTPAERYLPQSLYTNLQQVLPLTGRGWCSSLRKKKYLRSCSPMRSSIILQQFFKLKIVRPIA